MADIRERARGIAAAQGIPMSLADEVAAQIEDVAQQNLGNNAQQHLKSFVERIERLEEEKKDIANDIKDVYAEAKGNGFNAKVLREIIKLRAMSEDERLERDALIATYMHALGMSVQPNLPGVE